MWSIISGYLFIFFARICDVSLSTMRTIMVVRGQRLYAAVIGFFEVIIYIVVLNKIISSLNDPWHLLVYAAGYATGNFIGPTIEAKLAVGTLTVQVITMKSPFELSELLRSKGYGVTVIEGQGREGSRYILQIILPRRSQQQLRKIVDEWDRDCFFTVFDARSTKGGVFTRIGK